MSFKDRYSRFSLCSGALRLGKVFVLHCLARSVIKLLIATSRALSVLSRLGRTKRTLAGTSSLNSSQSIINPSFCSPKTSKLPNSSSAGHRNRFPGYCLVPIPARSGYTSPSGRRDKRSLRLTRCKSYRCTRPDCCARSSGSLADRENADVRRCLQLRRGFG